MAAAAAPPSMGGDGLHFVVPEGTASITGGFGAKDGSWAGWEVDKTKMTSVTIPTSVTSIAIGAFEECSSLASVAIPSSVSSIGVRAFDGCSSLASVAIPTSVTSIGDGAFYGCSLLASVEIPPSVTSIGESAFRRCISLTSLAIPTSVTTIGDGAFNECSSLTTVDIPVSVTNIAQYAFFGCSKLKVVLFQPSADDAVSAGTAVDAAVDSNRSIWSRLFAPIANESYDADDADDEEFNPREYEQLLPDDTKIWAPDSVVAQLTGQFKDYKQFADVPRAWRAAPDAKTWAGVQLWLWWLPPTPFCGDGSSNNGVSGVVCKSRLTTTWVTMLAGYRAEKSATLPRLPEELWLYMFGFLKHDQQRTFPLQDSVGLDPADEE